MIFAKKKGFFAKICEPWARFPLSGRAFLQNFVEGWILDLFCELWGLFRKNVDGKHIFPKG